MNVRGFAFLVMIKKWPCLMATGIVYVHQKGPWLRCSYVSGWLVATPRSDRARPVVLAETHFLFLRSRGPGPWGSNSSYLWLTGIVRLLWAGHWGGWCGVPDTLSYGFSLQVSLEPQQFVVPSDAWLLISCQTQQRMQPDLGLHQPTLF